jgi:hypothetical protein
MNCSACVRAVAAIVLVTIALVPSIARAHDRLDHQRTSAQQHSRFRWSNSCASVPQKTTAIVVTAPAEGPTQTLVAFPPRPVDPAAPADVIVAESTRVPRSHGFRAPPALL